MVKCCHGRQNDLAFSITCFNPSDDETGGRLELQLTWKGFIITFIWSYNIDIKAIHIVDNYMLLKISGSRETSRPAGPLPLTGGAKNMCMTEVSDGNALHGAVQHVSSVIPTSTTSSYLFSHSVLLQKDSLGSFCERTSCLA